MGYRRILLLLMLLCSFGAVATDPHLMGMWRFSKGNPVFSDFELSDIDDEREFYEWAGELPSGKGVWRWLNGNSIELSWSNGRKEVFVINKLDDKELVLTMQGSAEPSYFQKMSN